MSLWLCIQGVDAVPGQRVFIPQMGAEKYPVVRKKISKDVNMDINSYTTGNYILLDVTCPRNLDRFTGVCAYFHS